jgi:hypothetical protein
MTSQKRISETNPLRIAILCNGDYLHHWQEKCIREIQRLPYVKIVVLVKNKSNSFEEDNKQKPLVPPQLLYALYNKFRKPKAYNNVQVQAVLPDTETIDVVPIQKGRFSDYFSNEDLNRIRNYQPDALLRFGFRILRGDVLTLAPYGIWSYHHSDEQLIRGGPACFWEIVHRYPTTGAILQRLTTKIDGGVLLRKGYFKTLHHSLRANIDQVMYGAASWVKQVCIDIYHNQANYLDEQPVATSAPMKKTPANDTMALFLLGQIRNKLLFHLRDLLMAEFWQTVWLDRPISSFIEKSEIDQLQPLKGYDKHRYRADPFGFVRNDKHYLLYEDYNYITGRATINMQVLDANNEVINQTTLLKGTEHYSYPYVIEHNEEIYVLPESHEQNQTVLYRWDEKNAQLKKSAVLLEEGGIDPSLIYYNNSWWLFCTRKTSGSNLNLHIYSANRIEGPYTPHKNNPVKTDVSSARPGGQLFVHNKLLYRPAQNSAKTYGASLKIMEVTELSQEVFMEKEVTELFPPQNSNYNCGLHTLSSWGNRTLIDIKGYRFDRHAFFRQLADKLKKR